ncbi:hypothetical protein UCRPA7_315 [Phaeoacremonium minimum UCRPA7]|uniref:Uncharacterized protein n=1 Tax=Phaeoacremonium minimum (strain UCR-PA7) TaxID=1286976 RepID=R8BXZ1_PHAM7|nr:hypothetical protein UCRPA7_315 [Phaeoacremonium minimum UCRPA7]EOO04149.1 hypothetical protein UCRPA7_315 [Phaeoacremonium minimum UCRPA7]
MTATLERRNSRILTIDERKEAEEIGVIWETDAEDEFDHSNSESMLETKDPQHWLMKMDEIMPELPDPTGPVTAPRQKRSQLLQELLVHLIEAIHLGAVNVNDSNHRASSRITFHHNGNNNLALAVSVTGDMSGKLLDVRDKLGFCCRSCGTAHSTPERDRLTGYLPLEGT